MTISSASIGTEWFLDGISSLRREQIRTEREISSGFRVQDAADAPSQVSELVRLNSGLVAQQTYQANLNRVQTETNAADSAIGETIKLIESAQSVALQGAGSTATSADRQTLAVQIQSIQQQLLSVVNTNTEGRYIFGGDQDISAPYQAAPASSTGFGQLTPQTATRVITDPAGQTIYQPRTALTIFDHRTNSGAPAADNAFAALQDLQVSLTKNDPAGIATALTSLESVSGWLNQQQAAYGIDGQRLTQEQSGTAAAIVSLQTRISAIRDTDVVKAATDLAQENTAQSAAFSAQTQISRKSLFDYLG